MGEDCATGGEAGGDDTGGGNDGKGTIVAPGDPNPPTSGAGAVDSGAVRLWTCADALSGKPAMSSSANASLAQTLPLFLPTPCMSPFSDAIAAISSRCVCQRAAAVLLARRREFAMQDAIELLKSRRSVKPIELSAPSPSTAELETILTLAARVPDHGKLTPWRFIVFEGDARLAASAKIASVFRENRPDATADQIAFEEKRLARAPLVVAVVSRAGPHVKIPEWEQVLSAGAAAMNLVVAAHGLGYAANWITEWYAYDRRVLDALGLAAHEKIAGFVHIGTAARAIEDRARPMLGEIVTRYG
jgi:nitroreductase